MIIIPRPTKADVLDVGRRCQARCSFCYYVYQTDYNTWVEHSKLEETLRSFSAKGNKLVDVSGGEPTIYPKMPELVDLSHELGMRMCIITNGLCGESRLRELISHKVDLWRFSMHSIESVHDSVMHVEGARKKQEKLIEIVQSEYPFFHANMVLCRETQGTLTEFARYLTQFEKLSQFNVINFLPHYEWSSPENARMMIADLREVEPEINEMADILESAGKGFNIRYYPMCRIREDLRRVICNDLQVMFDPWEWSYGAYPKTMEVYTSVGRQISNSNEHKGEPCCSCSIFEVCGGINKAYHRANPTMVDAVSGDKISDPYYYRKNNTRTLIMPWKGM